MAVQKTNAMRILDSNKIKYAHYEYDPGITDGVLVADAVGKPREIVFKTLVTVGTSKTNYVFVIPVGETLDIKLAAKAVGEKSIAMIKQKELLPLTGYIHGGCSPIGMKKQLKTIIHHTAEAFDSICISAGKVGNQLELSPRALACLIGAEFLPLII